MIGMRAGELGISSASVRTFGGDSVLVKTNSPPMPGGLSIPQMNLQKPFKAARLPVVP